MINVRPKKQLGQHFLTDRNIAEKITNLLLPVNGSNILEVGPGKGILTGFLLNFPEVNLKCVEVDPDVVNYLISDFGLDENRIIHKDFLQMDFNEYFKDEVCVIGNFPYNISTQIVFHVLNNMKLVPLMVGMFQKEVAERIAADHGSKTYGILSVIAQSYYQVELLFTVNEQVFSPPPKVKSAVIRLIRKQDIEFPEVEYGFLLKVVKAAFGQRRKMLRNSLSSFGVVKIPELSAYLEKRPEQLSVSDFQNIAKIIKSYSA